MRATFFKLPRLHDSTLECNIKLIRSARRGGGRGKPPPNETDIIVVEKWCYFPELHRMTKVPYIDGIENGKKYQISIEIFACKFKIF